VEERGVSETFRAMVTGSPGITADAHPSLAHKSSSGELAVIPHYEGTHAPRMASL